MIHGGFVSVSRGEVWGRTPSKTSRPQFFESSGTALSQPSFCPTRNLSLPWAGIQPVLKMMLNIITLALSLVLSRCNALATFFFSYAVQRMTVMSHVCYCWVLFQLEQFPARSGECLCWQDRQGALCREDKALLWWFFLPGEQGQIKPPRIRVMF